MRVFFINIIEQIWICLYLSMFVQFRYQKLVDLHEKIKNNG
jgi:hypothetical protein